jgi:hypothetical protein
MTGSPQYDWQADAYGSWQLALAAIRERMIRERLIKENDAADDQAWFERMRRRVDNGE